MNDKFFTFCDFVSDDFNIVVESLTEFYHNTFCFVAVSQKYESFVATLKFLNGIVRRNHSEFVAHFKGCADIHSGTEFLITVSDFQLNRKSMRFRIDCRINDFHRCGENFTFISIGFNIDFHTRFNERHVSFRNLNDGFQSICLNQFVNCLTRKQFARLVISCGDNTAKRSAEISILFKVFERSFQNFKTRFCLVVSLFCDVVGIVQNFDTVEIGFGIFVIEFC